jgi:phosphotransferase system IIB component
MSSKKISQQKMANDLYQLVKKYGILDYENCMTRLRLKLKQKDVLDIELLKKVPGVINVIHPKGSDEYQIILGPGTVAKVYDEFKKIADSTPTNSTTPSLKEVANQVKFENQQKRSNLITTALSKFAKIFAPLIPAFIGAGLFAGIAGIMQSSVQNN